MKKDDQHALIYVVDDKTPLSISQNAKGVTMKVQHVDHDTFQYWLKWGGFLAQRSHQPQPQVVDAKDLNPPNQGSVLELVDSALDKLDPSAPKTRHEGYNEISGKTINPEESKADEAPQNKGFQSGFSY